MPRSTATEAEEIEVGEDEAVEETTVETVDVESIAGVHARRRRGRTDRRDGRGGRRRGRASPPPHGGFAAGEWEGSIAADDDGNGPETHPIKGNQDSMLYHAPDSRYYKITKAEVWFDTEEHAEAAGFGKPGVAAPPTRESN